MAVTIDYTTRVISIPKADLGTPVQSTPFEVYELDIDAFRLELKDIEDNVGGIPFVDTHRHFTTVTVGGVTLARVVEIINGYTVTFQNGTYAVNLVGANSNIGDVLNLNEVQVRSANSAGLTDLNLATSVWDELTAGHQIEGTTGKALTDAQSAGNPWSTTVEGNTDAGTFGELVGRKLLTVAKFLGLK